LATVPIRCKLRSVGKILGEAPRRCRRPDRSAKASAIDMPTEHHARSSKREKRCLARVFGRREISEPHNSMPGSTAAGAIYATIDAHAPNRRLQLPPDRHHGATGMPRLDEDRPPPPPPAPPPPRRLLAPPTPAALATPALTPPSPAG